MVEFGHLDAVRLVLMVREDSDEELVPRSLEVSPPSNQWHTAIAFEFLKLNEFTEKMIVEAIQVQKDDIRARVDADGRMINPSFPVQVNNGVFDTATLLRETEPKLEKFSSNLEFYRQQAPFGTGTAEEELARHCLGRTEDLIDICRLFLHSYLWILWMHESLDQASRFGSLLASQHQLQEYDDDLFTFIAHPPIVVATFACTALIEEVGAKFINYCTNGHVNQEETSPNDVIEELKDHSSVFETIHINEIENQVIDRRNALAHYIVRRRDLIRMHEFGDFYLGILEGGALVRELLNKLYYQWMDEEDRPEEHEEGPSPIELANQHGTDELIPGWASSR